VIHAHLAGALHQRLDDQCRDRLAFAFEQGLQRLGGAQCACCGGLAGLGKPPKFSLRRIEWPGLPSPPGGVWFGEIYWAAVASEAVKDEVAVQRVVVDRIQGPDRYATAALVADARAPGVWGPVHSLVGVGVGAGE
jgi:hypothetical protein